MCIRDRGGTALHLGAGIGDETTFLAFRVGQQGRVVAVEGSPDDFAFLARNISLGRYEGIVATVPAQADLADGHAALDAAPGWYGPHLGNPWTHLQHRPTGVVRSEAPQVPTVNTTQLVNDLGAVDLVLISETHRFGRLLGAIESPLLSGCVGEMCIRDSYEILYRHGGITVDADSECLRPLEDWLMEPTEWATWENEHLRPGLITNAFLGSVPESPFFGQLIASIHRRQTVVDANAWITTGPTPLTETWKAYQYPLTIYPSHYLSLIHI